MSASPLSLNCFILGDDDPNGIFVVEIAPTKTVFHLKEAVIAIAKKLGFGDVNLGTVRLWNASCPTTPRLKFKRQLKALTFDDDNCLIPSDKLSAVFTNLDPASNLVHVFIRIPAVPDHTAAAVKKLQENHAQFFKCLEVKVAKMIAWTKTDVESNNAVFHQLDRDKPTGMKDLESKLDHKRIFDPSESSDKLALARTFGRWFSRSYTSQPTQPNNQAMVENDSEFQAFYYLLSNYIPDAPRFKEPETATSIKANAMKYNFLYPPFFLGRTSADQLVYTEESSWQFPMFVRCDGMATLPRKYAPRSDFCVWFKKQESAALPLLIGEAVSYKGEMDRYRMLLQAVALARLVSELRQSGSTEQLFIVAIYMTKNLIAERYIVMKSCAESDQVSIGRKDFNLIKIDDAIAFQREMYNLASVLKSVIGELDGKKCTSLTALKQDAADITSLTASGPGKASKAEGGKRGLMDTIPEEGRGSEPQDEDGQGSEPEDEEDLGVFDDSVIRAVLNNMNYKIPYVAYGYPHLAPIIDRTTGQLIGCVKFVEHGAKETEIGILQYLAALPSELNHTIRPLGIWPVAGGSIIAMPPAGNRLTSLTDLDAHLWPLTRQLFEAVEFMHDHNVAHLDIKPANILVPSTYGRLTIIDFGLSVQLADKAELLEGHAGTQGYMAPEVGNSKFSPIRADLWSVGQVVKELCMLCRPSVYRGRLSDLSEQLLNDNPSKRPMMSEVLERMLDLDASEKGGPLTGKGETLTFAKAIIPIIPRPTAIVV